MSAANIPMPSASLEIEELLALLRASRERFLASFDGVAEADCRRSPAQGSWSVLDTVEHLTTAETIQLRLISTQRAPRPADAPNREQVFLHMIPQRAHKMESPEGARPI